MRTGVERNGVVYGKVRQSKDEPGIASGPVECSSNITPTVWDLESLDASADAAVVHIM
ncbi:GM25455 [Drosophila sechellia]|uniref:GM25455 n=1 Tax=Drosophila sechellia TaxID=7238 RepID=B4IEN0_DROSE|nr:GM25455 [Drosophila sechellia]